MTTTPAYSQKLHDYLRELHETASPAPWEYSAGATPNGHSDDRLTDADKTFLVCSDCVDGMKEEDIGIILEARSALPALLAEVERLQERERILAARLARVNFIAPVTYQLALSAGQGVGA